MADSAALNPTADPDGSGSLAVEGVTSFVGVENGQNNGDVPDASVGGQEEAGKTAKTAELPSNTGTQAISSTAATMTNNDASGAAGSPARTATPNIPGRVKDDQQQQQQQGGSGSSRAPSAVPTERSAMPAEAAENGAPTRVYLNQKVTQHVLDGMKMVAVKKPADPLRMLGEFLLKRSAEVEATDTAEDKEMNGVDQ